MYFAYLDESGDSGLKNSPTNYFVLSCVLVNEADWLNTLDLVVELRRNLKRQHNISTREELKTKYFKNGRGPLENLHLSFSNRMQLYRKVLQYQGQGLTVKSFAVAIDKLPASKNGWEPRYAAWTFALQRINRFCGSEEWATIYPD